MAYIYRTTSGLYTFTNPRELEYAGGKEVALSSCANIDVTDNGKIRRRDGLAEVLAQELGGIHSMYGTDEFVLFVEHDALSLWDGITVARLRNVAIDVPMSAVDTSYGVFYANGIQHGVVRRRESFDWEPPEDYIGPNSTRQPSPPPVGFMLAMFGAHLVVAVDNYLLFSEPFSYFHFTPDEYSLPLASPARMIREVDAGLWVSDQHRITFFAGRDPLNLDPKPKYGAPAVRGTDVVLDQSEVVPDLPSEPGVMVTAEDGVLLLTSQGSVIPLTRRKLTLPPGAFGTAMMRGGQYLVIINNS